MILILIVLASIDHPEYIINLIVRLMNRIIIKQCLRIEY